MQRILVLGPCGAGKSTLAHRLGRMLDLPVIHLDALNWQPGWVMAPEDELKEKIRFACASQRWIIDGNYSNSLPMRCERADTILFLDFPRWLYTWRVIKRVFTFNGVVRPDMGEGCPERLDWEFMEFVWNFQEHSRPRVLKHLAALPREKSLVVFHHPQEVESFVNSLSASTHR